MLQLQDKDLDARDTICSIQTKQNDEYIDWGDFRCIAFYRKDTFDLNYIKIDGIDSKVGKNDRIIIDRTVYDINEKSDNIFNLARNELESSFLKFEDMGVLVERGIKIPVSMPLSPEFQHYVDMWVGIWTKNIAKNYDRICQSETILNIKNRCQNVPAIIVGAGPSLDKNIEGLKDINAIIIVADRAYKSLLAKGIIPDLVISVDCHDGHILEYLNKVDSSKHILVMNTAGDYNIARMWQGRILYFNMSHKGMQFCDKVLPYIFSGFPAVANVGCVVNTACIIANWIGCKPLILIGCDFSYPDNKISCDTYDYINGSMQKIEIDEEDRFKKRSGKVKIRDIYTYPPFLDYLKTIKELDKRHKFDIVNATEGGIINGFPEMTLKEAKEKYCSKDIKKTKTNLNRR